MRFAILFVLLCATTPLAWAVTIDTVPVGNAGNPDDSEPTHASGAVTYDYRIGKYEVTNAQYVEFLNGVDPTGANSLKLYDSQMTSSPLGGIVANAGAPNGTKYTVKSGREENPVVFVNWFDAARFANWMHNGQGSSNTENGSYTLNGGTATPTNGNFLTRNTSATWCLPSEDEWYKAAYHKNDGVTGNYWDYPTSVNAIPASDQPPGNGAPTPANTANFFRNDSLANGYNDGYAVTGSATLSTTTNYLTNVGAFTQADSAYGTFDQGGNVWEWNDTLVLEQRRVAGGAWFNDAALLAASASNAADAISETYSIGFRLAVVVPPLIAGDYNHDGHVNAADYTTWRNSLGQVGAGLPADGNDNGEIDDGDYDTWKLHFGEPDSGQASVAGVPEPNGACALILATISLFATSRQLVARNRVRSRG